MLAVLHVTKSLLLEKAINEQTFNFLKLSKQLVELLVVVLFNWLHFFAHASQLSDLIFHFVLELCDFTLQIGNTKLLHHNDVMVAMLAKQTFKADAAKIILAESFDVFGVVNFALLVTKLGSLGGF